MDLYCGILGLLAIIQTVYCEDPSNVTNEVDTYKRYAHASLELEKQDLMMISSWTEEKNLKIVNVTSSYRLQVTKHKDHALKQTLNKKWNECLKIYKTEIVKPQNEYYSEERHCLKIAHSADNEKTVAVYQIGKEIKKWRKSLKYLRNLCRTQHYEDEEGADICLVEYMQRDNFNLTIQRLLIMKLEAMGELYKALTNAVKDLDKCLKTNFSSYLHELKIVWNVVNKCYLGPSLDLE